LAGNYPPDGGSKNLGLLQKREGVSALLNAYLRTGMEPARTLSLQMARLFEQH
jgi:hypothetical protein